MSDTTKATPGPWRVEGGDTQPHNEARIIRGSRGEYIARVNTNEGEALRIVRCVNSHDALVDLLADIVGEGERQMNDDKGQRRVEISKTDIRKGRKLLTALGRSQGDV